MTTASAYTGEVPIATGQGSYTLCFDWRALAAVRTQFGGDPFALLRGDDPAVLAALVAIGLRRHHGEMTAEAVLDLGLPLLPTQRALGEALIYAYYGPEGVPAAPENPPQTGPSPSPAKTP